MALAATIRINIVKQAEAMLFELRVLECLLADTVQYFEARAHRLEFLMESVLTEVCMWGSVPYHYGFQALHLCRAVCSALACVHGPALLLSLR